MPECCKALPIMSVVLLNAWVQQGLGELCDLSHTLACQKLFFFYDKALEKNRIIVVQHE